eukprot:4926230-Prymnesium_polylepis.1
MAPTRDWSGSLGAWRVMEGVGGRKERATRRPTVHLIGKWRLPRSFARNEGTGKERTAMHSV